VAEEGVELFLKRLENVERASGARPPLGRRSRELLRDQETLVGKLIAEVEMENRIAVEEGGDLDLVPVRERQDVSGDGVVIGLEGRPDEGMHRLNAEIAPEILRRHGHAREEERRRRDRGARLPRASRPEEE